MLKVNPLYCLCAPDQIKFGNESLLRLMCFVVIALGVDYFITSDHFALSSHVLLICRFTTV